MPIKKSFSGKSLFYFYKTLKVFFVLFPILAAIDFFSGRLGYFNIFQTKSLFYAITGIALYIFILKRINRKIFIYKNSFNSTTNFSYMPEVGIVSTIADHVTDFGAQNFPAFFPAEEINIKTYGDTEEPLADYKTFDFDYTNKTNPLLEKELFGQLEKVMQARGLSRVKKNPQIVVSMDFFIGKKEQYTPPQTVTSTELKSVWNFGEFGGEWGGFSSMVPVTTSGVIPGYTTTTFYSNIRLNFLNHAKLAGGAKLKIPPFIWIGESDNEGLDSDIRGIAPIMFSELMREFPNKSAGGEKRYIGRSRYGGLGLGFDSKDWRVVRYVEPSGVAAEHGIKPGDVLIKVNGNREVINWPALGQRYLNNPAPYRSKDPYFQYVLSNRGDSDVELVIQSAETGKIITLKMRPRVESRYMYVNINPLQVIAKNNPIGSIFVVIVSLIVIYYLFFK